MVKSRPPKRQVRLKFQDKVFQDDAHIFCTKDQVSGEVKRVLDFVNYVYTKFGFTYELKLSTRADKYLGDLETWDRAEEALEEALEEFGKPFLVAKAQAAAYNYILVVGKKRSYNRTGDC